MIPPVRHGRPDQGLRWATRRHTDRQTRSARRPLRTTVIRTSTRRVRGAPRAPDDHDHPARTEGSADHHDTADADDDHDDDDDDDDSAKTSQDTAIDTPSDHHHTTSPPTTTTVPSTTPTSPRSSSTPWLREPDTAVGTDGTSQRVVATLCPARRTEVLVRTRPTYGRSSNGGPEATGIRSDGAAGGCSRGRNEIQAGWARTYSAEPSTGPPGVRRSATTASITATRSSTRAAARGGSRLARAPRAAMPANAAPAAAPAPTATDTAVGAPAFRASRPAERPPRPMRGTRPRACGARRGGGKLVRDELPKGRRDRDRPDGAVTEQSRELRRGSAIEQHGHAHLRAQARRATDERRAGQRRRWSRSGKWELPSAAP